MNVRDVGKIIIEARGCVILDEVYQRWWRGLGWSSDEDFRPAWFAAAEHVATVTSRPSLIYVEKRWTIVIITTCTCAYHCYKVFVMLLCGFIVVCKPCGAFKHIAKKIQRLLLICGGCVVGGWIARLGWLKLRLSRCVFRDFHPAVQIFEIKELP